MSSKCGFQPDHNISIWTSPNLTSGSWSYAGNAINVADRPAGNRMDYFPVLPTLSLWPRRCLSAPSGVQSQNKTLRAYLELHALEPSKPLCSRRVGNTDVRLSSMCPSIAALLYFQRALSTSQSCFECYARRWRQVLSTLYQSSIDCIVC